MKIAAAEPGPWPWERICRALMQGEAKLRPWEITKLTISEIALLFSKHAPTSRSGGRNMTDEEIDAYCEWYWGLSPRQKLELAKEGKL